MDLTKEIDFESIKKILATRNAFAEQLGRDGIFAASGIIRGICNGVLTMRKVNALLNLLTRAELFDLISALHEMLTLKKREYGGYEVSIIEEMKKSAERISEAKAEGFTRVYSDSADPCN